MKPLHVFFEHYRACRRLGLPVPCSVRITLRVPDSDVIREQRLFDQSFLGLWSVSTSKGYFDIGPEIEDISFEGEGRVALIEEKKDNPTF